MAAVCRMALQAALFEQSFAVGHRHPAGSTRGLDGLDHRASRPVHFKKPHQVSGPPATTLQLTGLLKVGNADPRGDFLLFEAKMASRDYRGELLCQRLGLEGIRGLFYQLAGSLLHSDLRQQRATASPTLWNVHQRGVASPGHTGARGGVQPASG